MHAQVHACTLCQEGLRRVAGGLSGGAALGSVCHTSAETMWREDGRAGQPLALDGGNSGQERWVAPCHLDVQERPESPAGQVGAGWDCSLELTLVGGCPRPRWGDRDSGLGWVSLPSYTRAAPLTPCGSPSGFRTISARRASPAQLLVSFSRSLGTKSNLSLFSLNLCSLWVLLLPSVFTVQEHNSI